MASGIYNRFKALSADLNETLISQPNHFSPQSTGDAGIDIIGWIPFNDNLSSRVVYVGQCKCSDDWKKAYDPVSKLRRILTITSYIQLMFIPFCFRDLGGRWAEPQEADKFVTLDRFRIVSLFSNKINNFTSFKSYNLIKQFLTEQESAI